jgi:adenylate cyclase
MSNTYEIQVYDRERLVHVDEITVPVEIGRQEAPSEPLYSQHVCGSRQRYCVALLDEDRNVSRRHALLEPVDDGKIRVTNLSDGRPIHRPDCILPPDSAPVEIRLPVLLTIGEKSVSVQIPAESISALGERTRPPGRIDAEPASFATLRLSVEGTVATEDMIKWLESAMELLQSAASSSNFFAKAAQAAVELVGLDSGMVLLLQGDTWETVAAHSSADASFHRPSQRILRRVREERGTHWQNQAPSEHQDESLKGIQAWVAAPILHPSGRVIGAVYGHRQTKSLASSSAITKLDAMLVELLARGVATGLARLEQERDYLRLEQFFTPELAQQLVTHPQLLEGRDAHVSVLFCDIRDFSAITERLGPVKTMEWVGDVMQVISDCAFAHRGVVVDYIGDELMAMWGMPEELSNYAELACAAALDMLEALPDLNHRWKDILGQPIQFGIGINSGLCRVGNTGSQRKLKYGPLGKAVNVASRAQGVTKYLRTELLVTEATQAQLTSGCQTRRLCTVRVVNMTEPVVLYEVGHAKRPDWADLKESYQDALEAFEGQQFAAVVKSIGDVLNRFPDDGPSLVLLSRAVTQMVHSPGSFDVVWDVPGK